MKSELPIEIQRFKLLREELQQTQQSFAEALEISSSIADIERGKSKITGAMVACLLEKFQVNPLWLYGKSEQRFLDLRPDTSPKTVVVDPDNNENIVLVNVKAAAGYPHNLQDPEWYEQLPAFQLPLPEYRNSSFRGFQVKGDSMLPALKPGEWVLGRAVESIEDLKNNKLFVVVLQDSVLVKKIRKHEGQALLSLISLNEEYPPVTVNSFEVREIWEVHSKIAFDLEDRSAPEVTLEQIHKSIASLKEEIEQLKK